MNNKDDDIRMLMRRESAFSQLLAFTLAAVYGFISGAAALSVRGIVLNIARRMIYTADLEANQYRGIMQMWEIGTIIVLVTVWLMSVLVAWNRIGRRDILMQRIKIISTWCASAGVIYMIAYIIGIYA